MDVKRIIHTPWIMNHPTQNQQALQASLGWSQCQTWMNGSTLIITITLTLLALAASLA
jgi:hypothetical protein